MSDQRHVRHRCRTRWPVPTWRVTSTNAAHSRQPQVVTPGEHARLGQQRQQEPVPQVVAGTENGGDLLGGQRLGEASCGSEPHRAARCPPGPAAHLVQERLVGAPPDPPPVHQLGGDRDPAPSMEVIEAEHRGEMAVDRGHRPAGVPGVDHDHALGRGPQPGHEPAHVVEPDTVPGDPPPGQVLEPQPQARRVGPHRVRRALDGLQVRQVGLGRLDGVEALVDHRPRQRPARRCHHPLNDHRRPPRISIELVFAREPLYSSARRHARRQRQDADNRSRTSATGSGAGSLVTS